MIKIAIIKKLKDGKYRLYSRKKDPKTNKRRNLGTFPSLAAAKKHERAVQYFKSHADDMESDDKDTKMLSDLSDIATYLEDAGFVDEADKIYSVMDAIDGESYLVDQDYIPDRQKNIDGPMGDAGANNSFSAFLGQMAEDNLNDHELFDILDNLPKKPISKRKLQNEDVVARSDGRVGSNMTDNPYSGSASMSDYYFYRGTGSLENAT